MAISTSKDTFAVDEPVSVDVVLKNSNPDSPFPVRLLEWVIPCDSPETLTEMFFFDIKTTRGKAANYIGVHFKRTEPTDEDYKVLEPGEQISCTIDLGKYYNFASPNKDNYYEIMYSKTSMQLSHPDSTALEILQSNSLKLKIDAREVPPRPSLDETFSYEKCYQGSFFVRCYKCGEMPSPLRKKNIDVEELVSETNSIAIERVFEVNQEIVEVGNRQSSVSCPRYNTWFGEYDPDRHSILRKEYHNIESDLRYEYMLFDCQPEQCPT